MVSTLQCLDCMQQPNNIKLSRKVVLEEIELPVIHALLTRCIEAYDMASYGLEAALCTQHQWSAPAAACAALNDDLSRRQRGLSQFQVFLRTGALPLWRM